MIDAIINGAIAQRIFPGAVVLVAERGVNIYHTAYGSTMYDAPGTQPVTCDTIYDLASLTKMFTATAVLHLIERGELALDAPVKSYLPRVRSPAVTIWHLLTHTSGLDIRLSALRDSSRTRLLDTVYALEPDYAPGSVAAYTNVNSLLLGEILATVCAAPLDQIIGKLIIQPLQLHTTVFNPQSALLPWIAPTEIDSAWRGGLVHGTVHDESAHALGGVAGHAGLFSTAADVGAFCQFWLEAVRSGHRLLGSALAHRAITNQTLGLKLACGLGWMLDRTSFMGASAGTFGHTGFTGPVMLVVPAEERIVVILSNRVYPQRGPIQHHAVTAALVDHLSTSHRS